MANLLSFTFLARIWMLSLSRLQPRMLQIADTPETEHVRLEDEETLELFLSLVGGGLSFENFTIFEKHRVWDFPIPLLPRYDVYCIHFEDWNINSIRVEESQGVLAHLEEVEGKLVELHLLCQVWSVVRLDSTPATNVAYTPETEKQSIKWQKSQLRSIKIESWTHKQ